MSWSTLVVAVSQNQALLDGAMRASVELELLKSKPGLILPNYTINIPDILSSSAEGYSLEMVKKEHLKVSNAYQKECGDFLMTVNSKKTKGRSAIGKRFSTMQTRLNSTGYTLQSKL